MNESWVVKMLGDVANSRGIPYDKTSTNKEFRLGIGQDGRIYLSQEDD